MSEILEEFIITKNYAVLSGPTIAKEIVKGYPTAATIASYDKNFRIFSKNNKL
jgi:glycerol-3-phosphate dehydrogenase